MDQLLRLLRGCCLHCHHFKLSKNEIHEFSSRLRLLRLGLVREANEMKAQIDPTKGKARADSDEEGDDVDVIASRNAYVEKCRKRANISKNDSRNISQTETLSSARKQVIKDFYAELSKSKKKAGACHKRASLTNIFSAQIARE